MANAATVFEPDAAPESWAASYAANGYLLVRGLLDPERAIEPLKDSYTSLVDAMGYVFLSETLPDALGDYGGQPFPLRFATMLGASGGLALHHLDPVLNIFVDHFQYRRDLPTSQIPEVFACIRHARVLDVLEALLGPEVLASPIYHVNVKLAQRHLQEVESVAKASGQDNPTVERFYNFQVGKTDWHMDAVSGLSDSHHSRIANAWIPITEATPENGCLMVVPGSHTGEVRDPQPEHADVLTERAVTLPMRPGDVLFLDNKVLHSSTPNTSDADYRFAFNFRYVQAGQTGGRPFLPGFVARSRSAPESELHNPFVWSTMWDRALTYRVKHGVPYSYGALRDGDVSEDQARAITEHWRRRAPDPRGWLRLEQTDDAPLPAVSW
ncbi:MAG: phytanoyl-CoA dioxygenase family protein [Spirochaetaceae bacterium]|nr:phytanoyl-CoA dioxygenase family protein [Spirochaetaceae bacterium]